MTAWPSPRWKLWRSARQKQTSTCTSRAPASMGHSQNVNMALESIVFFCWNGLMHCAGWCTQKHGRKKVTDLKGGGAEEGGGGDGRRVEMGRSKSRHVFHHSKMRPCTALAAVQKRNELRYQRHRKSMTSSRCDVSGRKWRRHMEPGDKGSGWVSEREVVYLSCRPVSQRGWVGLGQCALVFFSGLRQKWRRGLASTNRILPKDFKKMNK